MPDEKIVFMLGMACGGLLCMCIFMPLGIEIGTRAMQRECVKHDAAEYDKKSGEWRWTKQIPGEQGR